MENIFHKKELVAVYLKSMQDGSRPLSLPKEPLQVLAIKRKKGEVVASHTHLPRKRVTETLQECLLVRKGKVRVSLYGLDRKLFKIIVLKKGEVLILLKGGHALEFLENTEIIEVKNGPYREDRVSI